VQTGELNNMVSELLGIQFNIAKADRTDRKVQNLTSYINVGVLRAIHQQMDKHKAYGIDKVTKEEYGQNLEENLGNLVERMKKGSYKPKPIRRVYIPKDGSKMYTCIMCWTTGSMSSSGDNVRENAI